MTRFEVSEKQPTLTHCGLGGGGLGGNGGLGGLGGSGGNGGVRGSGGGLGGLGRGGDGQIPDAKAAICIAVNKDVYI